MKYFIFVPNKDSRKLTDYAKDLYYTFIEKYNYSENEIKWYLAKNGIEFQGVENILFDFQDYILDHMYEYGNYSYEDGDYELIEKSKKSVKKSLKEEKVTEGGFYSDVMFDLIKKLKLKKEYDVQRPSWGVFDFSNKNKDVKFGIYFDEDNQTLYGDVLGFSDTDTFKYKTDIVDVDSFNIMKECKNIVEECLYFIEHNNKITIFESKKSARKSINESSDIAEKISSEIDKSYWIDKLIDDLDRHYESMEKAWLKNLDKLSDEDILGIIDDCMGKSKTLVGKSEMLKNKMIDDLSKAYDDYIDDIDHQIRIGKSEDEIKDMIETTLENDIKMYLKLTYNNKASSNYFMVKFAEDNLI